jgi:hypothetical protein
VQLVCQPGKPASLVGVENVPPLQQNFMDDQSRVDGRRVRGALGSQFGRDEKHRERQKVPKTQQNSNQRCSGIEPEDKTGQSN